jgi:hypothetical protein
VLFLRRHLRLDRGHLLLSRGLFLVGDPAAKHDLPHLHPYDPVNHLYDHGHHRQEPRIHPYRQRQLLVDHYPQVHHESQSEGSQLHRPWVLERDLPLFVHSGQSNVPPDIFCPLELPLLPDLARIGQLRLDERRLRQEHIG